MISLTLWTRSARSWFTPPAPGELFFLYLAVERCWTAYLHFLRSTLPRMAQVEGPLHIQPVVVVGGWGA